MDLLGLGASMGALLGTDATTGGYVVGGIFTMICAVAMLMVMSKLEAPPGIAGGAMSFTIAFGLLFSALVIWWPIWTVLVAFMFILFGGMGILGGRSS